MVKIRAFNILGNIAIVNFPRGFKSTQKKKFANKILRENKSVKTVLEKVGKVKGRLRKLTTKYIAGEKTKEVLYKENNCVFRFNIDTTYFSPRLSNERKEIAKKIKRGENVLVMFAGVAPFSIVIAKNSKANRVVCIEINRQANKYAQLNVELNKVKNKVEVVQGDVKKFILFPPTHPKRKVLSITDHKKKTSLTKYDVIVMPRPQLKESFLKQAFSLSKKGTRIFYYDFAKNFSKKNFGATKSKTQDFVGCKVGEVEWILNRINNEAKKARKKIKILRVKKAGEIAPYKIRVRVDFRVC